MRKSGEFGGDDRRRTSPVDRQQGQGRRPETETSRIGDRTDGDETLCQQSRDALADRLLGEVHEACEIRVARPAIGLQRIDQRVVDRV